MINALLNKYDLLNKNIIVCNEDSKEKHIFVFDSEYVVVCDKLSKAIKLLDRSFKKVELIEK